MNEGLCEHKLQPREYFVVTQIINFIFSKTDLSQFRFQSLFISSSFPFAF